MVLSKHQFPSSKSLPSLTFLFLEGVCFFLQEDEEEARHHLHEGGGAAPGPHGDPCTAPQSKGNTVLLHRRTHKQTLDTLTHSHHHPSSEEPPDGGFGAGPHLSAIHAVTVTTLAEITTASVTPSPAAVLSPPRHVIHALLGLTTGHSHAPAHANGHLSECSAPRMAWRSSFFAAPRTAVKRPTRTRKYPPPQLAQN